MLDKVGANVLNSKPNTVLMNRSTLVTLANSRDYAGLGSDPEILEWFVQAELVHCRWAMLGAAGIVLPGLLTSAGALNVPEWYVAGEVSIQQGNIPFSALVIVQAILFTWVELKRLQDFRKPASQADGSFLGVTDGFKGVANGYPGGLFDPMGMSKDAKNFATMKQKVCCPLESWCHLGKGSFRCAR